MLALVQPPPDLLFAPMFCVCGFESLQCGASLTRRVRVVPAPKLQRKGGGERWEGVVEVPLSEGVVKYQYVILSKTHRYDPPHLWQTARPPPLPQQLFCRPTSDSARA